MSPSRFCLSLLPPYMWEVNWQDMRLPGCPSTVLTAFNCLYSVANTAEYLCQAVLGTVYKKKNAWMTLDVGMRKQVFVNAERAVLSTSLHSYTSGHLEQLACLCGLSPRLCLRFCELHCWPTSKASPLNWL